MFRWDVVAPIESLASAGVARREWIRWLIDSPIRSLAWVAVLRREMLGWQVFSPGNNHCFDLRPSSQHKCDWKRGLLGEPF